MPWHKVHTGGKWKVVKDADGSVAGTHDTEEGANKQLAALYANEKPGRGLSSGMYVDPGQIPADLKQPAQDAGQPSPRMNRERWRSR
jgi:hypothetical protein